ncbi:MAG TPA: hypothetical protein VLB44_03240 [Kofleriaceae bacterium]|nr:hypothetical protein [Kofleriaceae bacterium]
MRPFLICLLIASSSAAHAGGMIYTPLVNISTVDPVCRRLARIPANTGVSGPQYAAAISTANCMIRHRSQRLVLTPSPQSVRDLDNAVATAVQILETVIATGDPAHAVLARYAELDLYEGNTARLLASVTPSPRQMNGMQAYEYYKNVSAADDLTQSWRESALEVRRSIAAAVRAHPDLANRDPVLAYAVAHSRVGAAAVATRR